VEVLSTHQAWLGIGSNIERGYHIRAAVEALEERFTEVRLSLIYESEAAGFAGPPFYNLVAWIETTLSLSELQTWCKAVEQGLGRVESSERFSSKTMDIDILLFDDLVAEATANTPKLPRGEVLTSAYVLAPLAELVPYMCHPETTKSYRNHWLEFNASTVENGLMGVVPYPWPVK